MMAALSTSDKFVLSFFESGRTKLSFDEFLLNSIALHEFLTNLVDSDTSPGHHIISANHILKFGKSPILTKTHNIPVEDVQNSCIVPKIQPVVSQPVKSLSAIDNCGTSQSSDHVILPNQSNSKNINLVQTNVTQNFPLQSDPALINIHTELTKINNKFLVSADKGRVSENIIYNELRVRMPHASIIFNRHTPQSADIIIDRSGHAKIIVENKDWVRPIISTEVEKFIRDIEATNHSGIFVSQESSITNINSFHFKIINNNVAMFIGNCNHNCDTIMTAIHILDQILIQLQNITSEYDADTIVINHQRLPEIVQEIQTFAFKKQQIVTLAQNMQKATEDLQIPLINELFKVTQPKIKSEFICDNCGRSMKSKGGLTVHLKSCLAKNPPAPMLSTKNN